MIFLSAKIRMPELKPCPICGGKPRFVKETVYNSAAYRVECRNCRFSTTYVEVGLKGFPGGSMTLSYETPTTAKYNAGVMWNKLPVSRYSCMSTLEKAALMQRNHTAVRTAFAKAGVKYE